MNKIIIPYDQIVDQLKLPLWNQRIVVNKSQYKDLLQLSWQWYISDEWLRFIEDVSEKLIVRPKIKINYIVCLELQLT